MRPALRLVYLLLALLCLLQITSASAQDSGYTYIVQPGDSWPVVARRVGLTEEELKAANPGAVRQNAWLIVGEPLLIPRAPDWQEKFYIVQRGDDWASVAGKFGLAPQLLQAANPKASRPENKLIVGERLLVPAILPTPTGPAPTSPSSSLPGSAGPAPSPTAGAGLDLLASISAAGEAAPFIAPNITVPLPTPVTLPPCPDAPQHLGRALNVLFGFPTADRFGQLSAFLGDCGADLQLLVNSDLNDDLVRDAVLIYTPGGSLSRSAGSDSRQGAEMGPRGASKQELLILSGREDHRLSFGVSASGSLALLAAQDINADGKADVVWTDTVCGSNSCFVTVHVRSWDGAAWRDWTKGTITMAAAEVSLIPGLEPDSPQEIMLTGGEYTGGETGPQRQRSAVWTSQGGAPYELSSERRAPSSCLYHTVLDANRALSDEVYLEKAQWLYTEAVENTALEACGKRPDELAELRSFSLFRLALLAGYRSDPNLAKSYVERLATEYADQIYAEVALRWLAAFQASEKPQAACRSVNDFAHGSPAVLRVLADFGYANPTFSADEVCPLLAPDLVATSDVPVAGLEGLPKCPQSSPPFLDLLPQVVNGLAAKLEADAAAGGEREKSAAPSDGQDTTRQELQRIGFVIAEWLQSCNAIAGDRGAIEISDLNNDGLKDLVIAPTLVTEGGYGPDGADGVLMVLHQRQDGGFVAAYQSRVDGEPKILAIGDANEDGKADLFWQFERCDIYCRLTVNAITWNLESGAYETVLQPGSAIVEGTATLELSDDGASGLPRIHRLWLHGGVSGTGEEGLDIPHTEIWYSVGGSPVRRFTWSFDRASEASSCLGLRLIEANVALQAAGPQADSTGYGRAIQLYRSALESSAPSGGLRPCSVQGTGAEEEMTLLRGLAGFRLTQALALNQEREEAELLVETLEEESPESEYVQVTRAWLDAFTSVPDPVAACAAVMSTFLGSPALWQITHEFGDDHPSLSVRNVCFVPGGGAGFEFRLTPNW